MYQHIPHSAHVVSPNGTIKFEGAPYGGEVSMFIMDSPPGHGSKLHRHPYSETWIVRGGVAEFTAGSATMRAVAGDIFIVPAGVWHRFENVGEEKLDLICIHAAGTMVQENFEDLAADAADAAYT
jgi:Mannose-6-phosphate isomerase